MHAVKLLHKHLKKTCSIHKKRLNCLFDIVETAMTSQYVTLTGLGRRLPGSGLIKHKIKKVDRLLGNKHLQNERIEIIKHLVRYLIKKQKTPKIIIDWSPLADHYYLLRASIPARGRSITIYEQSYYYTEQTNKKAHRKFLKILKNILPRDCRPVIITDAGFRNSWFKMVELLDWDWIGRVRNKTLYRELNSNKWLYIKLLYPVATGRAAQYGQVIMAKSNPMSCFFYLYKKKAKDRKKITLQGKVCRQSTSLKCAKREREPWLIASSLSMPANEMIQLYSKRTQIENSFRDTKNQRVGFSLNDTGTKNIERLNILLLIIFIASIGLWLIGQCAKENKYQYQFQANSNKNRDVLSNIYLGWQILFSFSSLLSSKQLKQTLDNFIKNYNVSDL